MPIGNKAHEEARQALIQQFDEGDITGTQFVEQLDRINTRKITGPKVLIVAVIALIALAGAVYWIGSPWTYNDCILSQVKSGMGDYAARLVQSACARKF